MIRHASELGGWELARAHPVNALRPLVREYVGWIEQLRSPLRRRELPTDEAPLIINFGAPFRVFDAGSMERAVARTSFVTGAYDTYQLVESVGASHGVQVNLTLLGMRLLVGRPIEEMANRALEPDDVFGAFARELTHRLHDAPSWEARFEYLDRVLLARLAGADQVPEGVQYAWHRLSASGGRTSISSLAQEAGWSHRHFIAQFRHQIGISPKVFARLLRFGRFVRAAQRGAIATGADGALQAGYFDQSHLTRDARQFAGATPGELLKSLIPGGGGFGI